MTLDECLNDKRIVEKIDDGSLTYHGDKYNIKVGDKYNRLTVVQLVRFTEGKINPHKSKGFIAKCDCGNYVGPRRLVSLLNGDSMSCGCYQRELHSKQLAERNFKHGHSKRGHVEHLYILWNAMIDRATNHNRWDSKHYADKGITVCEDWRDYTKFREWSLSHGYSEGMSIDRIDNDLGYCPDNCRWIPLKQQNKNMTTNRLILIDDKCQILADWCRELNLDSKLVSSRLSRGWSERRALGLE